MPTDWAAGFMTGAHPTSFRRRAAGTAFGAVAGRVPTHDTMHRDCGNRNPSSFYACAVRESSPPKTVPKTCRGFSTALLIFAERRQPFAFGIT